MKEGNRQILLSSSKAWINLYVKNQRRQDYPFVCNTDSNNSKNDGELRYFLTNKKVLFLKKIEVYHLPCG